MKEDLCGVNVTFIFHCAGKPIGNGFPMGAVIMTPDLAKAFDNGEQYFATCGGCTAAGAAGAIHIPFHMLLTPPRTGVPCPS